MDLRINYSQCYINISDTTKTQHPFTLIFLIIMTQICYVYWLKKLTTQIVFELLSFRSELPGIPHEENQLQRNHNTLINILLYYVRLATRKWWEV